MMKLLILGAAGRTGTLLVDQAIAAGHVVTAFVRKEDALTNSNVKTIIGDATNKQDLEKALRGQDAVVSTLGPVKAGDKVVLTATAALIKLAKAEKVKRVIMMSSFLAASKFKPNPIIKFVLKLMAGIVSNYESAEQLFYQSDLDYTIVYATRLTNYPLNSQYRIVEGTDTVGGGNSISRANVAEFLIKQLSDPTYVRDSVLITDK